MRTVLTAARLWDGGSSLPDCVIEIEDGRIAAIESHNESGRLPRERVGDLDFRGATLAPAFFDVHIHGAAGHDAMEATPEALSAIGRFLASHGTANFLATTVTAPVDATLRALEGLARLIERPELVDAANAGGQPVARAIGIHLEGPFLSQARRGVQPAEHLLAPDVALFDRFQEAAHGQIRLMTVAPELDGAVELVRHATARGVRVSLGHSDATAEETRAAIAAGAASATHTFNAMRPLHHHEPGILGVALTCDSLFAELICDGIHNTPEMANLWWRAKGAKRGILVTDAMSATGMPDGEYRLGGFAVQVANGRAMVGETLAGSVLTLDRAVANLVKFAGAPVEDALRMATVNPAAMTGMDGEIGKAAVGGPANLVAVDASGRLVGAIMSGRLL